MTTNHRDQIQAQIRRFDEIRGKSTEAFFADEVLAENKERGLQ